MTLTTKTQLDQNHLWHLFYSLGDDLFAWIIDSGAKPHWLCLPVLLLFSIGCLHQFHFFIATYFETIILPTCGFFPNVIFLHQTTFSSWASWVLTILTPSKYFCEEIEPDPERMRCSQSHLAMQRRAKTRTWGRVSNIAGQKHFQPFWGFPGSLLYIKPRGDLVG